jgi:hypothetical protein
MIATILPMVAALLLAQGAQTPAGEQADAGASAQIEDRGADAGASGEAEGAARIGAGGSAEPGAATATDGGSSAQAEGGAAAQADGGLVEGARGRLSPQRASAELAKKAVDIANIHLQAARLYALGLFQLARRPTTEWDRGHSISLFNQAQEAVTDADRSLAELTGMAKGQWEKASEPLKHARLTIVQVQKDLASLSVPPTGKAAVDGQKTARHVYDAIESVGKDLESAAKTMKVDAKLRGP